MENMEENFREDIGKKIKIARKIAKYTQEELAEKLSLTPEYISHLERGIASGSISTIINICKTLNINSDFLFSDLINNDSLFINDLVDEKFIESFLKLDDYNRLVVKTITKELSKLQEENKNKTTKRKAK